MRRTAQGFTLIELIIVITIIGILAAMALPRFAAMQADARLAKMNGALGSVKSAAAMAHGVLIARGFSSSFTGVPAPAIVIEGQAVTYTFGYPNAATIVPLAGLVAPEYTIAGLVAPRIAASDASHIAAPTDCTISYTPPAVADTLPTYAVTATVLNCT